MPFAPQPFDYVLLAVALCGLAWVLYGVLRRFLAFVIALVALVLLVGAANYVQTGCCGKGFFAERSAYVGFAGTLIDAWAGLGAAE